MVRRLTVTVLFLYAVSVIAVTIFPIRVRSASYWAGEPWWTMLRWMPGDVDAPQAWAYTLGSPEVTIAVLDSGSKKLLVEWRATDPISRVLATHLADGGKLVAVEYEARVGGRTGGLVPSGAPVTITRCP